jgi:hypothetical protein
MAGAGLVHPQLRSLCLLSFFCLEIPCRFGSSKSDSKLIQVFNKFIRFYTEGTPGSIAQEFNTFIDKLKVSDAIL